MSNLDYLSDTHDEKVKDNEVKLPQETDTENKNKQWKKWIFAALVVGVCGGSLYSHPTMLVGELVYDDGSTVAKNPVVLGLTDWKELFLRDFWGGDRLTDPKSHKSFRPVTTLTLRLNYIHATKYWKGIMSDVETYGFHIANMMFHVIASIICIPAAHYALGATDSSFTASVISALLFTVHPVHSEAVQNITGRAEPLMAIFFLSGFVVYASAMIKNPPIHNIWPSMKHLRAIFWTLVCLILALLSKEMGITLTMLCAYWDFFVVAKLSLLDLLLFPFIILQSDNNETTTNETTTSEGSSIEDDALPNKEPSIKARLAGWAVRTAILGFSTILIAWYRLKLNGGNPPFLRYNANRHALEPIFDGIPPELTVGGDTGVHGIYRWLSIAWLWVRYVQVCVCPLQLSADWSGPCIPLVRTFSDHRVSIMMVVFLSFVCLILWAGFRRKTSPPVMNAFGFFLFPFLLASNIFVVAGTTLAERVVYLPSFGLCIGFALILTAKWPGFSYENGMGKLQIAFRSLLLMALVAAFSAKCVERNFAWSSSHLLWSEAYRINPTSAHAIQNYAIHMLGSHNIEEVQKAADALESIRHFDEVDRVDADEMYSPLVLCTRRLGNWQKALEYGAEAWERTNQREDAYKRGVKLWHMHELLPNVEKFPLRRARILAGQATTMAHLDLKEAAIGMLKAVELASDDSVVMQMAQDLERYAANSYSRYETAEKPYPTQMYERLMAQYQYQQNQYRQQQLQQQQQQQQQLNS